MRHAVLKASAIAVFSAMPLLAQNLPTPSGEVVLAVSGSLKVTNVDGAAHLDLQMLEAFEPTTIETTTIWTDGVQTFTGVSIATLVKELGIEGTTLRATAINDYAVEIPLADAVDDGPILAYRLNGATMSVRDKGPLWVIYPYDADADYRSEVIYSRSIWQLDRIEAVD